MKQDNWNKVVVVVVAFVVFVIAFAPYIFDLELAKNFCPRYTFYTCKYTCIFYQSAVSSRSPY